MDKKKAALSQWLQTPERDEQGSLVTENGGHSLLPSPPPPLPPTPPLHPPIPHSKAESQALAHPRTRTRRDLQKICSKMSLKKAKTSSSCTRINLHRHTNMEEKHRDRKIQPSEAHPPAFSPLIVASLLCEHGSIVECSVATTTQQACSPLHVTSNQIHRNQTEYQHFMALRVINLKKQSFSTIT